MDNDIITIDKIMVIPVDGLPGHSDAQPGQAV